MTQQPDWAATLEADDLITLIDSEFERKFSRKMTKRGRSELRKALKEELQALADDVGYETGTKSPQDAAENFVDLAAGRLKLSKADIVSPLIHSNSLKPYTRVGVGAIQAIVDKARAYHKATDGVCPVWPF
jgi:hypothetical protein